MSAVSDHVLNLARDDLERALDALGAHGEEYRQKGEEVARMAADVLAARLAGEDVVIAEAALVASMKNLAAGASVEAARAILDAINRAVLVALDLLFAGLGRALAG